MIYYHTVYFRIYDKASYRDFQFYCESAENLITILYILNFFGDNNKDFSIIALLLLIFTSICFVYFLLAKGYFFFFDPPVIDTNEQDKDFYGITVNKDRPIPFEIRSQNRKGNANGNGNGSVNLNNAGEGKNSEKKSAKTLGDSARYDLVDNSKQI